MDFNVLRRLEREVIRFASKHGYNGDIFAADVPQLGTKQQELEAVFLSLALRPRPRTPEAREQARVWCRNIVLTSGQAAPTAPAGKAKARKW